MFVEETHQGSGNIIGNESEMHAQRLCGESTRQFYESLVNERPCRDLLAKNETASSAEPKLSRATRASNYVGADLLKLAQNNHADAIGQILKQNTNICIDMTDAFGWTALMCASCSGAEDVVRLLLKHKANPNISDKCGNTALTLARRNRFFHIVRLLENRNNIVMEEGKKVERRQQNTYCQTCDITIQSNSSSHESSTLHLFNSRHKLRTFYSIPESNKGFQMLLKCGWNREEGLGPRGIGSQFPVKVFKKIDRKGIGCPPINLKEKQCLNDGKEKNLGANKVQSLRTHKQEKCFTVKSVMESADKSLKYLEEIEHLGQEILIDRREVIALDNRRNQTREGLRALKNCKKDKSWIALGPLLVKMPINRAKDLLNNDQVKIDAEINKIRSNLKVKVNDLRDLEHQPPVPGLLLEAMSKNEMRAMGQVLGRHSD